MQQTCVRAKESAGRRVQLLVGMTSIGHEVQPGMLGTPAGSNTIAYRDNPHMAAGEFMGCFRAGTEQVGEASWPSRMVSGQMSWHLDQARNGSMRGLFFAGFRHAGLWRGVKLTWRGPTRNSRLCLFSFLLNSAAVLCVETRAHHALLPVTIDQLLLPSTSGPWALALAKRARLLCRARLNLCPPGRSAPASPRRPPPP